MAHLAVCHTVIVEPSKDGTIKYNAQSPDELALVNGARYFGYKFHSRDEDSNVVIEHDDGTQELYLLLNVIEFSSDRKRMTVVVRAPSGEIKVMMKGADSIILPRLKEDTPFVTRTN